VFTHEYLRPVRRLVVALAGAFSLVLGAALLVPAAADTPSEWETAPTVSPLSYLLVLLVIPLALAGVIVVLALLPSLAHDRGYEPGQSWRGESEWFGGPTKGVATADEVTPEQVEASSKDSGGTSGQW
jgi:predicted phage tail protein